MIVLERLLCNCMWLAWIGLFVSRRGARPEERPTLPDSSGDVRRCLLPDRTSLPGW